MSSNLGAVTRNWDFSPHHARQVENDYFAREYTKFDFTVDEGKERLNPSRDENEGKHCRRKVEKLCVTPVGASISLTSRKNRMTTHTHTHTVPFVAFDQRFS